MSHLPTDPYTQALGLTLLIEGVLLAPWLASSSETQRNVATFVGANLLTHGLLWSAFRYMPWPYPIAVGVAEGCVVAAEAVIYVGVLRWSARRSLGLSTLANATSTLVGLAIALPLQG